MKEITRIHLAKIPYEIEIDAKKTFEKYLNELRKFADDSIFQDVEIRITEILSELGVARGGIITAVEVEKIRQQIGEPSVFKGEDFDENSSANDENSSEDGEDSSTKKSKSREKRKLYRVEQDGILGGVAAGIAEYFGVEATWIRILFVVLALLPLGLGVPIYVLLILIIPRAKNASDILRLRGEAISAEGIRKINEEFDFEKTRARNKKLVRILGVIFGLGASLAALAGIWAIFSGNEMLKQVFEENTASAGIANQMKILIVALSNVAGVAFVIFCAALAHLGFTAQAKRGHFIAVMMTLAIGLTSVIGVFTLMIDGANKANFEIQKTLKTSTIKIDAEQLSKIKTLENQSNLNVEYIVSENRKVEISEFVALKQDLAKSTKFEFSGESLRISSTASKNYWGDGGFKVRIYGPELSKISTAGNFDYRLLKDQTSPLEVVNENDAQADFEIKGAGKVENLKVFVRNDFGQIEEVAPRSKGAEDEN